MRSLIGFLGGAVIVFLAVGYFRGWYTLDLNEQKIKDDVKAGTERIHELTDRKAKDSAPKTP